MYKPPRIGSLSVILDEGEVIAISQSEINLCKKEDMSICTADSRLHQENCSFYEKSLNANRCMYFVFEEYCDCLKAQMHAASGN